MCVWRGVLGWFVGGIEVDIDGRLPQQRPDTRTHAGQGQEAGGRGQGQGGEGQGRRQGKACILWMDVVDGSDQLIIIVPTNQPTKTQAAADKAKKKLAEQQAKGA